MAKRFEFRTEQVHGPLETELFRYRMDDPKDIQYTEEQVMLDIETHGDDYTKIRLIQIYQASWDKAIIFDTNDYNAASVLYDLIYRHVVIHNATFEIYCFMNDCDLDKVPFTKWSDTFLLARRKLFNKIKAFGLDAVAAQVHGHDYYKAYAKSIGHTDPDDIKKYKKDMQKSFLDSPKSNKMAEPLHYEQLHYAALDVLLMPKIYREVKDIEDEFIIQLDYKVIPSLVQWRGLPVDHEKADGLIMKYQGEVDECTEELPEGLNVNSWVQVRKLFTSEESDDTFLASIEDESKRDPDNLEKEDRGRWAHYIRKKRSAIKAVTFAKKYVGERFNGYASPRTISGRLAQDNNNLMQIARNLKTAFGFQDLPGNEDKWLIHYDYAGVELRMAAVRLGEQTLINLFESGADLHKYAASSIYDKVEDEITDHERFVGKTANFGLLYGAGAARFCRMAMKNAGLYIREVDAKMIIKGWKKGYPGIKAWHQQMGRSKTNQDVTLNGRYYEAKMYSDLLAIGNQGSAAEVLKLGLLYADRNLQEPICVAIHDSYIAEASSLEEARVEGTKLYKCAMTGWFEAIKSSKYPTLAMPGVVSIGKNWGEMEKGIKHEELKFDGSHEDYLSFREEVIAGEL